jgi:hypothetical protein
MPQPVPVGGGSGTVSVRPVDLYAASSAVATDQHDYHAGAIHLVRDLSGHPQLAGRGSGPDAFADAYAEVTAEFLKVWAASVVSVGGAAVGLTVTANNYRSADWHSDPTRQGPPPGQAAPHVVERIPYYGTVADIKYHGTGQDSSSVIVRELGEIPDWLSGELAEAVKEGLRLGKSYDITPSAVVTKDPLHQVAGYWTGIATTARTAADTFAGIVDGITDDNNGEWSPRPRRSATSPRTRASRPPARRCSTPCAPWRTRSTTSWSSHPSEWAP